jgi:hypothetical protein
MARPTTGKYLDILFLIGAVVLVIVFTTVYQMPFRLDDVLHMDWAREHTFWDAFDPIKGEIVRSYRPLFAATIWILTHTAGTESYFAWHITLVGSFVIGLAFTGLTARYLSKQESALYFTTGLYWLIALPILNVLFWFGDLTFTIELMFTGAAWYYGIRGLYEAKLSYWITGCLLGAAAIASKEPAILMVHSVFAGLFILNISDILDTWITKDTSTKWLAIFFYLVLCVVTLHIFFASPTRSNRFFVFSNFSREEIEFFIKDRYSYYGSALLNPLSRIVIAAPLVYFLIASIDTIVKQRKTLLSVLTSVVLSLVLSWYFADSLLVLSGLLITSPILYAITNREKRFLSLLPFSLSIIVTFAALMITVMLVKTQLTEATMLAMLISGISWVVLWGECKYIYSELPLAFKRKAPYVFGVLGAAAIYLSLPMLSKREKLLKDVQAVRLNANNSIKWMASHLPIDATVLVTGHSLYGDEKAYDLTSKSDDDKLKSQYTFLQGYIRSYFYNLGRYDLRVAYLEDSTILHTVLDSFKTTNSTYLFLQTELDKERFYGEIRGRKPITEDDSSLIRFEKNGFSSEVRKLGR